VRNPARERSRNLNREVWESPSVYGGEDVKDSDRLAIDKLIVTLIWPQPLSTPIIDKIGMKC
jgi:hypothetical protein